ncbi:protein phosphatase 1 regulatory subunit 15B [Leptodactylus fuscus]|uniref:protein phosphatase 1 regulatory subunit 15B n=1 Tax=Leptodactylus fuscus TaxID=238119 RepID=UPI003F4ECAA4
MCADRDSTSSPGFRALLGRFLHGLLQYRVFQLFGAAWSYLMGLAGASFLSLLPSAWVVHRSVGPDEFPEMLEALGLRTGPWEELEECLEELGPWKELLSPAMKADLEIMNPWKGYVSSSKEQESWDNPLEGLGTWHSKVQALWEPGLGTWKDHDQEEEDECGSKTSLNHSKNECPPCDIDNEKSGARLHSPPLGVVSCIFNPGSGGVFTLIDLGNDKSLQNIDLNEPHGQSQSRVEIEHIRSKRLWFLQKNQGQDVSTTELKQKQPDQEVVHNVSVLNDPPNLTKIDLPVFSWHDGNLKDFSPDSQVSDFDLEQSNVLDLPATEPDSKPSHPLSLRVPKPLFSDNTQNPPSPDQDQGYHSLEDWQCLNIKQNLQSGGISPPEIHDGAHVPTDLSCSVMKDLNVDLDSDDMDSDLEEKNCAPSIPVCTNKHIGYILGTVVSDDEEEDNRSQCEDDWDDDEGDDDDDGFDSEGSVSATEGDIPVPKEVVLWNSFCSADPYNPQNFTASLHTGPVAEENANCEDQEAVVSDEESWCDSDAVSDSDSEDDFSADEQENLKLWNGFLKSEDPYNPLCFKASVQTLEQKRHSSDAASKHIELVCTSPSSCELTVPTNPTDSQLLRLRETNSVSKKESANVGRKKVTFCDKITVYYVCNEEERKGQWEEFARDHCRFQRRIQETESVIGHCFTLDHRQRVWRRMQEMWCS